MMHAGWPMLDEMLLMLYSHPQLYVDLGLIDFALPAAEFHLYLRRLVQAGFGERIMFGSDQMVWPQAIERHPSRGICALSEPEAEAGHILQQRRPVSAARPG